MPGANTDVDVAPRDTRGTRRPRHVGNLDRISKQQLYPFMAAPLRPGETLAHVGIQGESWFCGNVQFPNAPLTYGEVMLSIIPLSALDQVFVDMYSQSAEDVFEETGVHLAGSGQVVGELTVAEQGHLTPGIQQTPRRWAGEHGGSTAGEGLTSTSYMPYVSFGTYKVAQDWYDMENTNDRANVNYYDNPPAISDFIRSATDNGFTAGQAGIDPDTTTTTDLSALLEHLFILSRSEMTYAEILAAHGINPMRVASLSRPVVHTQKLLRPQREPQIVGGPVEAGSAALNNDEDDGVFGGFAGHNLSVVVSSDTTTSATHQVRPFGALKADWSERQSPNVLIEEPSILLGTYVWWNIQANPDQYGHMLDMTRMVGPGQWGQRQNGGVDEEDFLAVQDLYTRDGASLQAGSQGESGSNVFNLLNLFMHGDMYSADGTNGLANTVQPFTYLTAGGQVYDGNNLKTTSKFSVDLHVRTDLVAQ